MLISILKLGTLLARTWYLTLVATIDTYIPTDGRGIDLTCVSPLHLVPCACGLIAWQNTRAGNVIWVPQIYNLIVKIKYCGDSVSIVLGLSYYVKRPFTRFNLPPSGDANYLDWSTFFDSWIQSYSSIPLPFTLGLKTLLGSRRYILAWRGPIRPLIRTLWLDGELRTDDGRSELKSWN